jgi:PTS system galactitol-specific IIB component
MSKDEARILVCCADGAATSAMALTSLREALEDNNIFADLQQGRITDVLSGSINVENYDLIVSTVGTDIDIPNKKIPIFSGVPFLTGVGKSKVIEDIIKVLK